VKWLRFWQKARKNHILIHPSKQTPYCFRHVAARNFNTVGCSTATTFVAGKQFSRFPYGKMLKKFNS
jgi:hypothetical protein